MIPSGSGCRRRRAVMMGRQSGDQTQLFYMFNLEERFPDGHLLRRINPIATGAQEELRENLRPFYSKIGRPSIDPELMLRMLIVGYCDGVRFERAGRVLSRCPSCSRRVSYYRASPKHRHRPRPEVACRWRSAAHRRRCKQSTIPAGRTTTPTTPSGSRSVAGTRLGAAACASSRATLQSAMAP